MAHSRHQMDNKTRKKMEKETKKAQEAFPLEEEQVNPDSITAKSMLEKYPKKVKKLGKIVVKETIENMQEKKKKHDGHESKRTTPGLDIPERDLAPASSQQESTRWKKTVDLQARVKGKMNNNKFRHSLPRKGHKG